MSWINFSELPLWQNLGIFVVAGVIIWYAGTSLANYADGISDRIGLGKAFVGLLFLALATELPEIGTTITASASGNASLAVNNLFGGVVMQTAILAVVDIVVVSGALTCFTSRPTLLLQGILLALLLSLTLAAMAAGEMLSLFSVGLWTVILFGLYILTLYLSHHYEGHEQWHPDMPDDLLDVNQDQPQNSDEQREYAQWSLMRLGIYFTGVSVVILFAGVTLAYTGEALASQTGLGTTFIGATLLATSTSLPELSTCLAAARLGNYSMAVSNIFGSNAIMVALLFFSDLVYRQGPILDTVESTSIFLVAVGVAVTCVYLAGVIERRDQVFLGMGIDSLAVLIIYGSSLVILYLIS